MKRKSLGVESLEMRAVLSASSVVPLELVPQQQAPPVQENVAAITATTDQGDLNSDGLIDANDIDLLGSNFGNHSLSAYDLNTDGAVDRLDLDMLVRDIIGTEYGDADLSGSVNGLDAAIVFQNIFSPFTSDEGRWARGDFTMDGIVDGFDFMVWNDYKGFESNTLVANNDNPLETNAPKQNMGLAVVVDAPTTVVAPLDTTPQTKLQTHETDQLAPVNIAATDTGDDVADESDTKVEIFTQKSTLI